VIIIKGKKIRWIILGVCLILFTTIMIFVITKNKLYIDDIGYNIISKLRSNNMDKIVKIITNIGGTIVIGIVTIISLFIFRNKKINICIVLNLLGIVVLNNVIIKNIIGRGPGKNRNNLELCPTVVARCGGCCSEDFCCQWECRLLPV
jgi:hypothetical protein